MFLTTITCTLISPPVQYNTHHMKQEVLDCVVSQCFSQKPRDRKTHHISTTSISSLTSDNGLSNRKTIHYYNYSHNGVVLTWLHDLQICLFIPYWRKRAFSCTGRSNTLHHSLSTPVQNVLLFHQWVVHMLT